MVLKLKVAQYVKEEDNKIFFENKVTFPISSNTKTEYALKAIIYGTGKHFRAIVKYSDGVYQYDGLENNGVVKKTTYTSEERLPYRLPWDNAYIANLAIYAAIDNAIDHNDDLLELREVIPATDDGAEKNQSVVTNVSEIMTLLPSIKGN